MDPITLMIMLGFKLTEEVMVQAGATENTILQPMKYADYKLSEKAIKTLKLYESWHPYGMDVGDGKITVGYGTVDAFYDNGKPLGRKVRKGETVSQLKTAMGYYALTDVQFAERLMINHSKVSSYRLVAKDLDDLGVPYHVGLAEALSEWSYNTGCAFYSTLQKCNSNTVLMLYSTFKNQVKASNGDTSIMSIAYFNFRFKYLQRLSTFNKYAFGWLKRVYISAMMCKDLSVDTANLKKILDTKDRGYLKDLIRKNFGAEYTIGW